MSHPADAIAADAGASKREGPKGVTATPRRETPLASSLVIVENTSIQRAVMGIWVKIGSATRNILEDVPEGRARWVMDPHDILLTMFEKLFTKEWEGRIIEINAVSPMSRKDALDALLAAAIFIVVFEKKLPWDGPKELLAKMGDNVPVIDRILHDTGQSDLRSPAVDLT